MKRKTNKCKNCNNRFDIKYFNQKYCMESPECTLAFIEYTKELRAKQDKKTWNKEKKHRKEQLKTRTDHLNELQVIFNKYIRTRDKGKPCISCKAKWQKDHQAGHYFAVGGYPCLRVHEWNVHSQCIYCNKHLHSNNAEYSIELPKRIGLAKFQLLKEMRNKPLKATLPEIILLKAEYKQKIKNIQ